MKFFAAVLMTLATMHGQALITDIEHARWQHDADDPPGGESAILRTDQRTGAMEFLARYPAGFAFKTHAHKANERFILLQGKARVESGATTTEITAGGFAYLPKGTAHRITCASATPCTFYLFWDAKP